MSKLKFSIDKITNGAISGWAWDEEAPDERITVDILHENQILATAKCDGYREDLELAGIGDGFHSFEAKIMNASGKKLNKKSLQVVQTKSHSFESRPKNYIEITDLFVWWQYHRPSSGIQRVILGYVSQMLCENRGEIEFIARANSTNEEYSSISNHQLLWLIDRIEKNSISDEEFKISATQVLQESLATNFISGSNIVIIGAFWVWPDISTNIKKIADEYQIKTHCFIYDCIPISHPEVCDKRGSVQFFTSLVHILSHASSLFTISNHVAADIRRFLKKIEIEEKKIAILTMGDDIPSSEVSIAIPELTGKKFVLCVGTIEARKNHKVLVRIWKELHAELLDDCPTLVFAGRPGWLVENLLSQLDNLAWIDGKVLCLNGLSDAQLSWLYQSCEFTVFPSICEGWGLPVRESLMYGKACIASNATSIPEAGGSFATYASPNNEEEWERLIRHYLNNPKVVADIEALIKKDFRPTPWSKAAQIFMTQLNDLSFIEPEEFQKNDGMHRIKKNRIYKTLAIQEETSLTFWAKPKQLPQSAIAFGKNWFPPEFNLIWSKGKEFKIVVRFDEMNEAPKSFHIKVLTPYYFPESKWKVFCNDLDLGLIKFEQHERSKFIEIKLPKMRATDAAEIRIVMVAPAALPSNDVEIRPLGLGIQEICYTDTEDLMGRLTLIQHALGMQAVGFGSIE